MHVQDCGQREPEAGPYSEREDVGEAVERA